VGAEHLHLFEMVDGLVRAGAETVCHATDDGPLADLYAGYRPESQRRDVDAVVGDDSLDLVVLAGVPAERAGAAVEALRAGRHVLAAKPAVTTEAQLVAVDAAVAASGRRWWVFFSERLVNRAVAECVRRVRAGEIGEVVAVSGSAPHTLAAEGRPEWFFDPTRGGGVLVDLAAHQADQLVALCGPGRTEVAAATVANVATPEHPAFRDLGRMSLRHSTDGGRVVVSDHHVDWLSPSGLGTWGDVRLVVHGTAGTMEVRANIDPAGEPGAEHLIAVDDGPPRRVDTSGVALDWAERLVADVAEGTDTLVPHDHTVAACRITLAAQAMAEAHGTGVAR
jgi:predicted dehydrogenase